MAVYTRETIGGSGLVAGVDYQVPLVAGVNYQTPLVAGVDYVGPALGPMFFRERARQLLGITSPKDYFGFDEDWTPAYKNGSIVNNGWDAASFGGAPDPVYVNDGVSPDGVMRFDTHAGGGTNQLLSPAFMPDSATKKWYVATLHSIDAAANADTRAMSVMLRNFAGNKTIGVGFFGPLSAVNAGMQYDGNRAGSFLSLGAKPAGKTWFEMAHVGGGVIKAAVSAGSWVTGTMVDAPTGAMRVLISASDDNNSRLMDHDSLVCIGER